MSTTGSGPSRRSHTKSRKGCKTCKRRHIRCDETFPQCRNCTKHQVRCDYMDTAAPSPSSEERSDSEQPVKDLLWNSELEGAIDYWQRTGFCVVGEFRIDLNADGHTYTRADLHAMYHCLSSAQLPETNEFTVWSGKTPKFLKAATTHPFLVHAILAFGCLSLAWEANSGEAKNMAYRHGGIALQGLQRAISAFSKENSDAVLAASCLLSWQANDWRSWASLVNGTKTVVESMQLWKNESVLQEVMDEQEIAIPSNFSSFSRPPQTEQTLQEYNNTLLRINQSLETIDPYLVHRQEEHMWVAQLKDYIDRLLAVRPANSVEEQFNHLYAFRKWLFWVPPSLLRSPSRDYMTLVILAYYYTAALELEPLFPNVASPFCSTMSVKPLEEIFRAFDDLKASTQGANQNVETMLMLLEYPRQAAADYHLRGLRQETAARMGGAPPADFDLMNAAMSHFSEIHNFTGQRSPAFGYSPAAGHHGGSPVSSTVSPVPYGEIPISSVDSAASGSPYQQSEALFNVPALESQHQMQFIYDDASADTSGGASSSRQQSGFFHQQQQQHQHQQHYPPPDDGRGKGRGDY